MPRTRSRLRIEEEDPTAATLVNMLGLPLILRDLVFLGEIDDDQPMSGLANGGAYAVATYLVIVTAASAALQIRIDEGRRGPTPTPPLPPPGPGPQKPTPQPYSPSHP